MESIAHQRLKRLAIAHLRSAGAHAVATEVRCPISRYRVDVAAYRDRAPARSSPMRGSCPAETIMIECKAAREDFLRQTCRTPELLSRRRQLERIREAIERTRIPVEEPHLRVAGSSLFPEMDEWAFEASRLPGYRDVLRKLARLDAKLYGETKFHLIGRYRLADRLYLAAPRGVVRRCELPPGWGLLECPPSWLDAEAHGDRLDQPPNFHVTVEAEVLKAREQHRQRLLRNIAVAASYAAFRPPRRAQKVKPAGRQPASETQAANG